LVVFKDVALVTVRNSSSRLPNKAILKIKQNIRSIDIIVERAKKTGLPVIITTSTSKEDDIFENVAREHNVMIFRGSLLNKIKRWHDCFEKFGIENALTVDGDDLAHNYEIGFRAMEKIKSIKSDIVANPDNIITGFFTYVLSKNAINKMYEFVSDEKSNTDVITRYIEKANLTISYVDLFDYEKNKNIRLTLDYEEDFNFFQKLYENIDILENGKNIIDFLEKNPSISEINFGRQRDFLANQAKFNEEIK